MLCQIYFHAFRKLTAREHNSMLTPFAFQSNIRAQANYSPFIRAARMRFSQTQMVVQLQVRKHGQDYTATMLTFV
jgi:hypothetical protein